MRSSLRCLIRPKTRILKKKPVSLILGTADAGKLSPLGPLVVAAGVARPGFVLPSFPSSLRVLPKDELRKHCDSVQVALDLFMSTHISEEELEVRLQDGQTYESIISATASELLKQIQKAWSSINPTKEWHLASLHLHSQIDPAPSAPGLTVGSDHEFVQAVKFVAECERLDSLHRIRNRYIKLNYVSPAAHEGQDVEQTLHLIAQNHLDEFGYSPPYMRLGCQPDFKPSETN